MKTVKPPAALALGLGLFALTWFPAQLLAPLFPLSTRLFWMQVIVKTSMTLSALFMGRYIFRLPASAFSLRRQPGRGRSFPLLLAGLVLGMLTTFSLLLLRLPLMFRAGTLHPLLFLAAIWIFSTVGEEIFCRGWLQSIVREPQPHPALSARLLTSALAFSLLHSTLFISTGVWSTPLLIMASMFLLGLICARLREIRGLRWAIGAHLLFNIGGMLAAIAHTLATR